MSGLGILLCSGTNSLLNVTATADTSNSYYKNIDSEKKHSKKSLILDEIFEFEEKSNFKAFNDPSYVGWLGDIGDQNVRLNYDPLMKNGIINKNPIYVFGGMNYSIKSDHYKNAFVRIKDVATGAVYLSAKLPENYTDPELTFRASRDTQISIQITSPTGGDSKLHRFTLTLDDF